MSLLEHPTAQALLADAEVSAVDVASCRHRLESFLQRYLPRFYRVEQHELARVVLQGKLGKLQRKTSEPIAVQAGRHRKPVQHFVGAGGWDDEAVMSELRRHVAEHLRDDQAVLVLDPSAFPKSGCDSCGVARQWCGRLGKVENCQLGVFLALVSDRVQALVDRRLYLPQEWANDAALREQTHVPLEVSFQQSWRIGLELLERSSVELPFAWVAGDDEFGRCAEFRAQLRGRQLRYVLDVPCNTLIRVLDEEPAPGRRFPPWRRVDEWARAQPQRSWRKVSSGDGSKGPKVLWAIEAWVQTKEEDSCLGPRERLVVLRTVDQEPQSWYTLSNARAEVPLVQLVAVHGRRHGAEELFATGKGEVGLAHYEVRSWVGWHHHMTLSLMAVWFLQLEKGRLGKKNPGTDGAATAGDNRATAAGTGAERRTDRGESQRRTTSQRRGAHLPLGC
jgi:SRSO17 transposase